MQNKQCRRCRIWKKLSWTAFEYVLKMIRKPIPEDAGSQTDLGGGEGEAAHYCRSIKVIITSIYARRRTLESGH